MVNVGRLIPSNTRKNTRKTRGDFFTPPHLARALTQLAIPSPARSILDPCYGGCVFLTEAYEQLQRLGVKGASKRLFGIDINPGARRHLATILAVGASHSQFLTGDFLGSSPRDFGNAEFSLIIGNPPYIRHHSIPRGKLARARTAIAQAGVRLNGRSNYWAYFLVHSMNFIEREGSLALILPVSFLFAHFAEPVRELLVRSFGSLHAIMIARRMFEDAEERTVLLLAKRRGGSARSVRVSIVNSLAMVNRSNGQRSSKFDARTFIEGNATPASALLNEDIRELLKRVATSGNTSTLREWATVKIGVVTGANHFFAVPANVATKWRLPTSCLIPVVTRANQLVGISLANRDITELLRSGARMLLVQIGKKKKSTRAKKYFEWARRRGASSSFKTRQRTPWHAIPDVSVPSAFLTYMSDIRPRIVANKAGATSTNAVHRLFLHEKLPKDSARVLAFASLSSLSALSMELSGRSYGGGVLKLEPGGCSSILIPLKPGDTIPGEQFAKVDAMLRTGKENSAREEVDTILLKTRLKLTDSEVALVRRSLTKTRTSRIYGSLGP